MREAFVVLFFVKIIRIKRSKYDCFVALRRHWLYVAIIIKSAISLISILAHNTFIDQLVHILKPF